MWKLIKTELLKLRWCQILLVGLVALALGPLVQVWKSVDCGGRVPKSKLWFFHSFWKCCLGQYADIPSDLSLVMIGSWLIDRESTHDTLENIMTIPTPCRKCWEPSSLGRDFAVLLGIYSAGVTFDYWIDGWLSGPDSGSVFSWRYTDRWQLLTTYLVCMPLILIFGLDTRGISWRFHSWRSSLDTLAVLRKGGILASIYKFSLRLILVGFDRVDMLEQLQPRPLCWQSLGLVSWLQFTGCVHVVERWCPVTKRK